MRKWFLLAFALVLMASLAGDVFFVHHHLSDFSVASEHAAPQYAPDFLSDFVGVPDTNHGLLTGSVTGWPSVNSDSIISCFCGWHNSAYLNNVAPFIYSGRTWGICDVSPGLIF